MAKLHHATLKAALAAYAILLTEGKNEAEIKEAISQDEKNFSEDEITQIYNAIVEGPKDPKGSSDNSEDAQYIVLSKFRDKDNFDKEYQIGDDVSDFDPERIERLVELKLVEKV